MSCPVGRHGCRVSSPSDEGSSGFFAAYSERSSSQRASRCWRSWLGLRLFLAGAGVLGVHFTLACMIRQRLRADPIMARSETTLALTQFAQGLFLSHFILRV